MRVQDRFYKDFPPHAEEARWGGVGEVGASCWRLGGRVGQLLGVFQLGQ